MKYPIDTEKYIAAMQMEFGPSKAAEEVHRIVIPLVNRAYLEGLNGRDGYSEDPEQMLADWTSECGVDLTERLRQMVRLIARWRNEAYAQGLKDGEAAGK